MGARGGGNTRGHRFIASRIHGRSGNAGVERPPRWIWIHGAIGPEANDLVAALAEEVSGDLALFGRWGPFRSVHGRVATVSRSDVASDWLRAADVHDLTVVATGEERCVAPRLPKAAITHVSAAEVVDAARASSACDLPTFLSSPMQRLARRLLGRTVALVLGAGGAKGLAHVGVLRALERSRTRVDLVVGSSVGALIGGFAARPMGSGELHDRLRELALDFRRRVVDLDLLGRSLLRGRKKARLLEAHACDLEIEDLAVPFRAVTADLQSGCEVVLSRGAMCRAIDAATAVPMIFPPVEIDGRRLVDGWMIDPLPVDVAFAEGASRVIAVDPTGADEGSPAKRRPARSTGAKLARLVAGRLRTSLRELDAKAREQAAAARARVELCIQPGLAHHPRTDVRRFDEVVAIGERATEESLPAIRAALSPLPPRSRRAWSQPLSRSAS